MSRADYMLRLLELFQWASEHGCEQTAQAAASEIRKEALRK